MLIKINVDPVLITIGGLKIHWYGIMIAIGLYAGIQVALRDAPRRGVDRDKLLNVSLLAAVLGILGGRLYYVVQNQPSFYFHHPEQILAVWQGGMAFFGAIFGGALAVALGCWRYRLNVWSVFDLGALGLLIGQAFGRVGNIINGDIVGYRTNGWGFEYTNPHTFAPLNTPVQPASLYELLIALGLFVLFWAMRTRLHPEGVLAMLYVVAYSVTQFLVFFLRDNVVLFAGLKQAQLTSIATFVIGLAVLGYLWQRERRRREAERGGELAESSRAGELAR